MFYLMGAIIPYRYLLPDTHLLKSRIHLVKEQHITILCLHRGRQQA